jgi:hypothetical protein
MHVKLFKPLMILVIQFLWKRIVPSQGTFRSWLILLSVFLIKNNMGGIIKVSIVQYSVFALHHWLVVSGYFSYLSVCLYSMYVFSSLIVRFVTISNCTNRQLSVRMQCALILILLRLAMHCVLYFKMLFSHICSQMSHTQVVYRSFNKILVFVWCTCYEIKKKKKERKNMQIL